MPFITAMTSRSIITQNSPPGPFSTFSSQFRSSILSVSTMEGAVSLLSHTHPAPAFHFSPEPGTRDARSHQAASNTMFRLSTCQVALLLAFLFIRVVLSTPETNRRCSSSRTDAICLDMLSCKMRCGVLGGSGGGKWIWSRRL